MIRVIKRDKPVGDVLESNYLYLFGRREGVSYVFSFSYIYMLINPWYVTFRLEKNFVYGFFCLTVCLFFGDGEIIERYASIVSAVREE